MINEKIVPISPCGFRFPTETEMAIDETLKLCGISGEDASMMFIEVMKKIGKNDNFSACCTSRAERREGMTREEALRILRQYDVSAIQFYETDGREIPWDRGHEALEMAIKALQQPEPCEDAEFWRKRVDYYSKLCFDLIADMNNGVTIDSVEINEDGIKFTKKQQELKTGKWIQISPAGIYECSNCGQYVMTGEIDSYHFCHGCGEPMVNNSENVRSDKICGNCEYLRIGKVTSDKNILWCSKNPKLDHLSYTDVCKENSDDWK